MKGSLLKTAANLFCSYAFSLSPGFWPCPWRVHSLPRFALFQDSSLW